MIIPNQYALKFPATNPDRIFSEAPPCPDDVTTSRTCADSVEVNSLTTSGMIAPASVPHVMMMDNFHHNDESPTDGISVAETINVRMTERIDVSQTSEVRGSSKLKLSSLPYFFNAIDSLMKYDAPEATTIITRIIKIQTSN